MRKNKKQTDIKTGWLAKRAERMQARKVKEQRFPSL
jgi:hypothetical protein